MTIGGTVFNTIASGTGAWNLTLTDQNISNIGEGVKAFAVTSTDAAGNTSAAVSNLVVITEEGVRVTAKGWYFVRGVAMVFDRHLQADRNRTRFSRIL